MHDILGFVLISIYIYIYIYIYKRKWVDCREVKKKKNKINERNGRDAVD